MIACAGCGRDNRDVALHCRFCGVGLPRRERDPFGHLLGLDAIVAEVRQVVRGAAAAVREKRPRLQMHHVVLGRSGAGKTAFARALAEECANAGLITSPQVVRLGAVDLKEERDLPGFLARHAGRLVVIDEAHELVVKSGVEIGATHPLSKLHSAMQRLADITDPIIVLSGLPGAIREYFESHKHLKQQFSYVVSLPELTPTVMQQLALRRLADNTVSVPNDARDVLLARFRHVYNDNVEGYENGYAVMRDVDRMLVNITDRNGGSTGAMLKEADVPRPLHEVRSREEILSELDALVGMGHVRAFVGTLLAQADLSRRRLNIAPSAADGARAADVGTLDGHVLLLGNPGTGKTTVARILSRILGATGLLPTERLIEVDRGKMVAEHVGGTARLVHQVCDAAKGGVLFIDEAYELCRGPDDTFGLEAIAVLLKRMEDERGQFLCVLAGYTEQMIEWVRTNPGLERRLPAQYRLTLPDYDEAQLAEIFRRMVTQRGLAIAPDADIAVTSACRQLKARATKRFGNAGEVRNLVDAAERAWASRSSQLETVAYVLEAQDIHVESRDTLGTFEERISQLGAVLDEFVGLADVKRMVLDMAKELEIERDEQRAGRGRKLGGVHFTFTGNPGTGKTVVARKMGEFFHAAGLLPTPRLVEVKANELIAGTVGNTAAKTEKQIELALGGVLFIDEAHHLLPPRDFGASFNRDVLEVLLKRMEDDRGKFVVVAAGYYEDIQRLLDSDAGFRSRFTHHIHFPDYTSEELLAIIEREAKRDAFVVEEETRARMKEVCDEAIATGGRSFGNGRFARKLLDATIQRQRVRLADAKMMGAAAVQDQTTTLRADDVPESALPLL